MISRIKQKPKQIFSWYNRDNIENNKGKEASAMGRHSKTVIEYRSYEFPPHFPLRVIAGEEWRISDVPSGVLHFHNCLEIGICESDSGKMKLFREGCSFQSRGYYPCCRGCSAYNLVRPRLCQQMELYFYRCRGAAAPLF